MAVRRLWSMPPRSLPVDRRFCSSAKKSRSFIGKRVSFLPMKLAVFACAFACLGWGQQNNALVERIGTTGFLQLEAASFRDASPRQQELAYWLTQASIAINP